MTRPSPIPDVVVLAAVDRAERHRGRPGASVGLIFEHLGIPRRSRNARAQLRAVGEVVQKIDRTVAPKIASAWPSAGVVEPFVSRHELARLMGVSIDTVDRLVAEGMPSVTWGRRTRRFRPSVAIGWASDRVRST